MIKNLLIDVEEKEANSYLVDKNGNFNSYFFSDLLSSENTYRLYRFLTELEDTINNYQNEEEILKIIIPKVRKLLIQSEWIQFEYILPNPEIGWSVNTLYDEPDFPLTIQMVTWLPGQISPIHNHGTWGIVAIISGTEKNTFWQKYSTPDSDCAIEYVSEKVLSPGDIMGFTSDAIHQVEVMGDEPVVSFNIYGITDYTSRFEFDPIKQTATNF